MNQKVIIYIILSAILLYLYYKRGNLAIFAAFVAVVGGTLIFRDQIQNDDREGFGMGGGGGDKECAKMGFTETKMDKKNLIGSLKKINDNFKKAVLKYAKFNDDGAPEPKKETIELLKPLAKDSELEAIIEKEQKENKYLSESKLEEYPNCTKIDIKLDDTNFDKYPYLDTFRLFSR